MKKENVVKDFIVELEELLEDLDNAISDIEDKEVLYEIEVLVDNAERLSLELSNRVVEIKDFEDIECKKAFELADCLSDLLGKFSLSYGEIVAARSGILNDIYHLIKEEDQQEKVENEVEDVIFALFNIQEHLDSVLGI